MMTKVKIIRAEKLISGLGGEKERWTNVSDGTIQTVFSKVALMKAECRRIIR